MLSYHFYSFVYDVDNLYVKAHIFAVFDVPCSIINNCSDITGDVMCNKQLGKCSCAEGFVRMKMHHHCLPCEYFYEF